MDSAPSIPDFLSSCGYHCQRQADDVGALIDASLAPPIQPLATSTGDQETLLESPRSKEREWLWFRIKFAHLHLAVHTVDHARTLGMNLVDGEARVPIFAHTGMARAALESSGLLLHLLAEGEPFEVRLARGVALLIVDAREGVKAASRMPKAEEIPEPGEGPTAQCDRLLAQADRALIELIPNRTGNQTKGIRIRPGREVPLAVTSTELAQRHFGDMPAIYALLSGVVHGMPGRLTDSASLTGQGTLWQADPVEAGISALAAVAAASRAGAVFARWRGFADHPLVAQLESRVNAIDSDLQQFGREWRRHVSLGSSAERFLTALATSPARELPTG